MGTITPLHELPGYKKVQFEPLVSCVGIKVVSSTPMTLGDFNTLLGKEDLPYEKGFSASDKGYLVEYVDGYLSWSPADQFEKHYASSGSLSYEMALYVLKSQSYLGAVIYRSGWNGANQHILIVDSNTLEMGIQRNYGDPSNPENNPECPECLFIKTTQNKLYPWSASPGDVDAKDWCVKYLTGDKNDKQ